MLLKGDNIHLRALEPEDVEIFAKIENEPELWACSSTNVPYSRFAIRNFISSTSNDIYADKQVRLVACRNTDDVAVAFADITDFDPRHKHAQVGIVVFPDHRKHGIGGEVLDMCFMPWWRKAMRLRAGCLPRAVTKKWLCFRNGCFLKENIAMPWFLKRYFPIKIPTKTS